MSQEVLDSNVKFMPYDILDALRSSKKLAIQQPSMHCAPNYSIANCSGEGVTPVKSAGKDTPKN